MGGVIPKPVQSSEEVGHDSKGYIKYGRNSVGLVSYEHGGVAVGAIIWQRELGGDRGDAQCPGGVPPSGGATDHGDEKAESGSTHR